MTIKKGPDEIWYWYQKIEKFHASGMREKQYCDENDIDYRMFKNMRYRIEFKKFSHPEVYENILPITRKYITSGVSGFKFSKIHNVDIKLMNEMRTHLAYVDIIEDLKEKYELKEEQMSFIRVPANSSVTFPIIKQDEPEVVKKQNDIEIIITKGVKVIISPTIDSMKIIKIIELLKDL